MTAFMVVTRDVFGAIAILCLVVALVLVAIFTVPWRRICRRGVRK